LRDLSAIVWLAYGYAGLVGFPALAVLKAAEWLGLPAIPQPLLTLVAAAFWFVVADRLQGWYARRTAARLTYAN
jgi:hypothetical protein